MFGPSKLTRTLAVGLLAVGLTAGAACSSDGSEGSDRTTTTIDNSTTTKGGDADNSTGTVVDPETTGVDDVDPTDPGTDGPSDTGPSDDPQEYIDKMAADISGGEVATKEQGECIGERWVEVIGFDAIRAAGMSPSDFSNLDAENYQELGLSNADAESLFDAFDGCGIALVESFRASFGEGLSATQQACIDDVLTEDLVKDLFVTNLLEGNDPSDGRTDALDACFEK